MCISGGVMVDQAIVQPLTEYICLAGDPDLESRVCYVAKVFHALKSGLDTLRRFYDALAPIASPVLDHNFPYTVSYTNNNNNPVEFSYICRLQPDTKWRALFEAKAQDKKKLVVKFTRKYNPDAHRLLATRGLAPQLHYAGPHAGGLTMVVMDYIHRAPAHWTVDTNHLSEGVLKDIEEAVELLHGENLVFGDLRLPNILVLDKEDSCSAPLNERWAMLVDFDWCSLDGEGTYPVTLNDSDDMQWHEEVQRGGIMRKSHDLYLLERLRIQAS
jgi:hypothetical protein